MFVMRKVVMDRLQEMDISVCEEQIEIEDIYSADELL